MAYKSHIKIKLKYHYIDHPLMTTANTKVVDRQVEIFGYG